LLWCRAAVSISPRLRRRGSGVRLARARGAARVSWWDTLVRR
jgi:hypothetical protein